MFWDTRTLSNQIHSDLHKDTSYGSVDSYVCAVEVPKLICFLHKRLSIIAE